MRGISSIQGWSAKELQVLETLTIKVRMLTLPQVAQAWWAENQNPERTAETHLARLEANGLVERHSVDAEPLLPLPAPILTWQTNSATPDFRGIARALITRWREPSGPTKIYVATKRAANLFGSYGGGLKDRLSATHDLHLGQVYLFYLHHHPADAQDWRGEDVFRKAGFGIKDPDAFLVNPSGVFRKVIEFGGRYDHRRVAEFHSHCAERQIEYELW